MGEVADVSEILARIRPEQNVKKAPSFAQTQKLIDGMPELFVGLNKQINTLQKAVREQSRVQANVAKKQIAVAQKEHLLLERIHDRLDSLLVEGQVTNVLLSELIAIQRSVITDNVDGQRDAIRNEAYDQILSGK